MASLTPHHEDPLPDAHAPAEEEGEICAICLETLPRWTSRGFVRFECCGKGMHRECEVQLNMSACSQNCPMCRAPAAGSDEEQHKRCLRWAKKGKAWAMDSVGSNFHSGLGVSESKEMARLWYKNELLSQSNRVILKRAMAP